MKEYIVIEIKEDGSRIIKDVKTGQEITASRNIVEEGLGDSVFFTDEDDDSIDIDYMNQKMQEKIERMEIEERKKAARDAEILASLDNNSPLSEEFRQLEEKWVYGEITDEEFENSVFNFGRKQIIKA